MTGALRILFISTGLEVGGAELALFKVLAHLDRERIESSVVSLTRRGLVADSIESLGIPVQALNIGTVLSAPAGVARLARIVRSFRPRIVQTWMYHANLAGSMVKLMANDGILVWGIRQSDFDVRFSKSSTVRIARLGARISRFSPDAILCCSEASAVVHREMGYCTQKLHVIPNGFELDRFAPDEKAREQVREELGLAPGDLVVGLAARFDPQKDHRGFIEAAAIVAREHPSARFVLCGQGMDASNRDVLDWIGRTGYRERFHLLGRRSDIPRLTCAFDVAVSSSAYGEGFCNALGEAMACGVGCVTTDVGDSAIIVGDTGWVVPPRAPEALASALRQALCATPETRRKRGAAARARIARHYDIRHIAHRYQSYYEGLVA